MSEEYFDAFRLDVRHGQRQLVTREFWNALDYCDEVELSISRDEDYWDFEDLELGWAWVLEAETHFNQFALNDFMALG